MPRDEIPGETEQTVPGIDITVIETLGGDRQIQLRTCILQSATEDAANAIADRMLVIADRQKAKYDLERLEDEFATVGITLSNLIDGLPHAERNFQAAQHERANRIAVAEAGKEEELEAGYDEHVASKRQGSYVPKGARAQKIEGFSKTIAALKVEMEKADAERAQHRQELVKSIAHYQDDLAKRRRKINALRQLAGMPPNEQYLEAEGFTPSDD